jgi:hypothetical protein
MSRPRVKGQNTPSNASQKQQVFRVCPVCGIPARGSSYGIHDECAVPGFVRGLAGDLIDLAFGRKPAHLEPIKIETYTVNHPASHTAKYLKRVRVEEIRDAEFRIIDEKGKP